MIWFLAGAIVGAIGLRAVVNYRAGRGAIKFWELDFWRD